MFKSHSKLIFISIIIFIAVITVIIIISSKKSPPSPAPSPSPTLPVIAISEGVAPSPIYPADFTGADAAQTLPPEVQSVGEQKTALRRLTPLYLDFAVIEFDYENDIFLVQILDPVEENKAQFASWRLQNYPVLLDDQFIVN